MFCQPQIISQNLIKGNAKHGCTSCSTGKLLLVLLGLGVTFLMLTHTNTTRLVSERLGKDGVEGKVTIFGGSTLGRLLRKPPRLPPRLPPGDIGANSSLNSELEWKARQQSVKKSFIHAWSGYKKYAMGYDELMPISHRGVDGLGGLGATIVDALDTAMIMGADDVVSEASAWIETELPKRITEKGQVNLFETTIRVLGGLLSAHHLSSAESGNGSNKSSVYLDTARSLADRLLSAFTSSPTPIPYSDVILHDSSAHPAPDGLSSTSEASTLQLEFNYLSTVSGDPKYGATAMKVLEHIKTLPKVEGLVPIYIRYNTTIFRSYCGSFKIYMLI